MAVGIPSFPARDSIICLFAELNCAIVVAIRPRQRPYDVALTHRCPNSVEITALGACALQRAILSLRNVRVGRACQATISLARLRWGDPFRGSDAGGSLVSHRHGVLFGYEYATFSISNDDVHQRECRPAFLPMRFATNEICHIG
jgi:hypothetical protein